MKRVRYLFGLARNTATALGVARQRRTKAAELTRQLVSQWAVLQPDLFTLHDRVDKTLVQPLRHLAWTLDGLSPQRLNCTALQAWQAPTDLLRFAAPKAFVAAEGCLVGLGSTLLFLSLLAGIAQERDRLAQGRLDHREPSPEPSSSSGDSDFEFVPNRAGDVELLPRAQ